MSKAYYTCDNCDNVYPSENCSYCITDVNGSTPVPSQWVMKKPRDAVNHPPHYQSESGLETIDVIEAFTSDMTGVEAFCTGNAIKYLCRWKKKNGIQDLKKAEWYINKLVNDIENKKESK